MFQALFVKVVPYQCLGCMWSQRDKKENMSPTIRATIAQFNTVTNQVITSLLCQPTDPRSSPTSSCRPPTTPVQRARIIEKWIRVAQVSEKATGSKDLAVHRIWVQVSSPTFHKDLIKLLMFVQRGDDAWLLQYLMWNGLNPERLLLLLQDCRQLKNFSSLRAILSALQSNAVYRLRKTWAAVNR